MILTNIGKKMGKQSPWRWRQEKGNGMGEELVLAHQGPISQTPGDNGGKYKSMTMYIPVQYVARLPTENLLTIKGISPHFIPFQPLGKRGKTFLAGKGEKKEALLFPSIK